MKPSLSRTILGGLAGTIVMTLMMYFVSPMMGVKMDIAASLGTMLGGSWTMGMMMHFLNGAIIFPLLYAFLLFRFLPGGPLAKGNRLGIDALAPGASHGYAYDGGWHLQLKNGRYASSHGLIPWALDLWRITRLDCRFSVESDLPRTGIGPARRLRDGSQGTWEVRPDLD